MRSALDLSLRHLLRRLRTRSSAAFCPDEFSVLSLDSIHDAVLHLDAAGRIRYINRAAAGLLDIDPKRCAGVALDACMDMRINDAPSADALEITKHLGESWLLPAEAVLLRPDGSLRAIEGECRPLEAGGALLILRDMSEQRRARRWLAFQATHDNLTTLLNRGEMERRIAEAIGLARDGKRSALLFIDLDQFKIINDTCGHHAGDEFLRRAARTLREHLPHNEPLARLGGDEFAVLVKDCPMNQVAILAETLIRAIHDIRFTWEQRVFRVGASVGVVEIDTQFKEWKEVLSLADSACYLAKDHGRGRVWIARKDDDLMRRRRLQMDWVARITGALEDDRFVVYRQQIAPLEQTGRRSHWEVLTRLAEPDRPLATPDLFIPAAERYGLMPALDRWVVGTVFRRLVSDPTQAGVMTAINVSGTTLGDNEFVRFIADNFRRYNIDPRQICFEITETAAATDFDSAIRFINAVRKLGCKLSLDDFGAGFSSFSYLKAFKVDYLKIDGGFVRDMDTDTVNARFVESMNHLGKSLGLATIAEYVETASVVERLRNLGVDYAQGNFLGRPHQWIN
ncbi:MAG: EAL domain-containing protein [Proteobacteria bacterium]|nr:EAL domain-containing protein [Pseudomonadota bacterium]